MKTAAAPHVAPRKKNGCLTTSNGTAAAVDSVNLIDLTTDDQQQQAKTIRLTVTTNPDGSLTNDPPQYVNCMPPGDGNVTSTTTTTVKDPFDMRKCSQITDIIDLHTCAMIVTILCSFRIV